MHHGRCLLLSLVILLGGCGSSAPTKKDIADAFTSLIHNEAKAMFGGDIPKEAFIGMAKVHSVTNVECERQKKDRFSCRFDIEISTIAGRTSSPGSGVFYMSDGAWVLTRYSLPINKRIAFLINLNTSWSYREDTQRICNVRVC